MLDALNGKWRLVESENFDKYLDALDVSLALKKAGTETDIQIVISQVGNKVKVQTITPWGCYEIESKLGVEFDETTLDDRDVKSCLTDEDDKLTLTQKWNNKETVIVREIKDEMMVTTFTLGEVTAVRKFERT